MTMKQTVCWDSPCVYGKPICCLECYAFKNCPERCDQIDCEVWKEKEDEAQVQKRGRIKRKA